MSREINNILNYIPFGKDNAVKRSQLCFMTGYSDRKVRKLMEQAKQQGYLIAAAAAGGYYRVNDKSEAQDYFHREYQKAKTLFQNLNILRKNIKEKFPELQQPELKFS